MSNGRIINIKIFNESISQLKNSFFLSFDLTVKKKDPSFNPIPALIKIAGISKIPWGSNFNNVVNPSIETDLWVVGRKGLGQTLNIHVE